MGQSSAGTWGHGFAWKITNDGEIHGRLRGYGALNQAGLPCFLSMVLARKCGVEDPEIDGVERKLLHPVLAKLLKDPSGRTRGSAAYAFAHFSRRALAEMAQEVYDAVVKPAPHYRMFSDDARQQALKLLLKYRIAEGIPLALSSMDLKDWGGGERLPHRWEILRGYGGSAKPHLPQLRTLRAKFKEGSKNREALEDVITTIEKDEEAPALVSLHTLVDEKLARDLTLLDNKSQEVAACRALIKENPGRSFCQAACLRRLVNLLGEDAREDVQPALKSDDEILREAAEKLRAGKKW